MSIRCALGDMARVVRNTTGCPCTAHAQGSLIYCGRFVRDDEYGPGWLLQRPMRCANCGFDIFGFLDADLDPIRPPARKWSEGLGFPEIDHQLLSGTEVLTRQPDPCRFDPIRHE